MLKKAIALTAIGAIVVFGVIAAILLIPGNKNKDDGRVGELSVIYNAGYIKENANRVKEEKRNVPLYWNEEAERAETREEAAKLPSIEELNFQRPGYTFTGWRLSTMPLDKVIEDGYVPAGLSEQSGQITFVAVWTANTYTISFDPVLPLVVAPAPINVTVAQPVGALPTLADVGELKLQGWTTDVKGQGLVVTANTISAFVKNTVLYAYWVHKDSYIPPVGPTNPNAVKYMVTTASNLNLFPNSSEMLAENSIKQIRLADYDKYEGYRFDNVTINGQAYTAQFIADRGGMVQFIIKGEYDIVANYTAIPQTFTVTFNSKINGGTGKVWNAYSDPTYKYNESARLFLTVTGVSLDSGEKGFDDFRANGYIFAGFSIVGSYKLIGWQEDAHGNDYYELLVLGNLTITATYNRI